MTIFTHPQGAAFEDISLPPPPRLEEGEEGQFLIDVDKYMKTIFMTWGDLEVSIRQGWIIKDARVVSISADKVLANSIFTQDLFVGADQNIRLLGSTDRIEIWDKQATPKLRIILAKLSAVSDDWGIEVRDSGGTVRFKTGTATFMDGVIITNATITGAKLVNATISQTQMGTGSVGTNQLIDTSITTAKIQDAAITNAKIGNLAVDTAQINSLAVTNLKVGGNAIDENKRIEVYIASQGYISFSIGAGNVVTKSLTVTHNLGRRAIVTPFVTIGTISGVGLGLSVVDNTTTGFSVLAAYINPDSVSHTQPAVTVAAHYW